MDITLLAIESSCDETSASIIYNGKILNNIIARQTVHEKYGGVVPELASRAHMQNIVPVVDRALAEADIRRTSRDAIAYTQGPGLLGALLVGSSFARSMAMALDVPVIAVNHMRAHVLAHFIDAPKPSFPFLCLTVSGGHTQIVHVKDYLDMEVIGTTLDDAVGESFDKTAKLLGLPYPGGPLIDQYAREGDPEAFTFPETDVPGLDYSFSGIKTAIMYFLREQTQQDPGFVQSQMHNICASVQKTLIDMLLKKLEKAADQTGIRHIAIAGGVSANSGLRARLRQLAGRKGWTTYIPKLEYCTDNAAMIAMAAHYQYRAGRFADLSTSAEPRLRF